MRGRLREGSSIRLLSLRSGRNKWYQSFQVWLGISEDSEGSRSDSVEIVCRSPIKGIGVRGIVCRSQKDARSAQGIFGGVDPMRNSI